MNNWKTLILVGVFVVTFNINIALAGGVTDTNNGSAGDLLIHSGTTQGANDVGTWTDSSSFKGEKGDQGDTGTTGQTGIAGATGSVGDSGEKGNTGSQGENGQVGKKGTQGSQGIQGEGLNNRVELIHEEVLISKKRWELSVYGGIDVNNNVGIFGVRSKHYFGESWTEKQLRLTDERLNQLENAQIVDYFERDKKKVIMTKTGFTIKSGE